MKLIFKCTLIVFTLVAPVFSADYRLQTLETAHALFQEATNATLYAEAAQHYDYLVKEEGIQNGHLFYTLGNSWFMAGDVGRAILNYRRAEHYISSDADLNHNLKVALETRIDLIPEQESHPRLTSILGWHFNTATALRWWTFVFCWLAFWGAWFWMTRSPKKEARIAVILAGAFSTVLLISLVTEELLVRKAEPGVIVAPDVLARKGNGNRYAPAFLEPLHSGSEFQRLEERGSWWHIRLADGQTCWIPATTAETVALAAE